MSNDKLKESFIKEILRISNLSDKLTQQDYNVNHSTGYSLANLKNKRGMNFNELKEAAGLRINNIGSHRKKKVKVVPDGETRECNKCLDQFHQIDKEITCEDCTKENRKTSEDNLYA